MLERVPGSWRYVALGVAYALFFRSWVAGSLAAEACAPQMLTLARRMNGHLKSERLTRRRFIQCSAMTAAAALPLLGTASKDNLPIGFSTLGCPAWDWHKILYFGQQNGFAAVELRGLQGNMDLPSRPEFAPEHIAESKKEVTDRGLRISCVDSSANMHDADPEKHQQGTSQCKTLY